MGGLLSGFRVDFALQMVAQIGPGAEKRRHEKMIKNGKGPRREKEREVRGVIPTIEVRTLRPPGSLGRTRAVII